eukprot:15543-Pelagomonas_calceolata.AAC.1
MEDDRWTTLDPGEAAPLLVKHPRCWLSCMLVCVGGSSKWNMMSGMHYHPFPTALTSYPT